MKYDFFEIVLAIGIILLVSVDRIFAVFYLSIVVWEILKNRKMDEMEKAMRRKSSEFTFYIVILLTIIFMSIKDMKITSDIFYFYNLFPLIMRNVLYMSEILDKKKSVKITGYLLALILALYTFLGNGFSVDFIIEMSIPLIILITTVASLRFPLIGGSAFLFLFTIFSYFIFRIGIISVGQIITYFLL